MLESIRKLFLIDPLDKRVEEAISLVKSINDNKSRAIEVAEGFVPLLDSLNRNVDSMGKYCELEKSDSIKHAEGLILLYRMKTKLAIAESEYYREIGQLRKSNSELESKLSHLKNDKELVEQLTCIDKNKRLEEGFSCVTDNFKKGLLPKELFLKAVSNYNIEMNRLTTKSELKKGSVLGEYGDKVIEAIKGLLKSKKEVKKAEETYEDKKIAKVMKEFAEGKLKSSSGEVVTDKKQALAIAYSYFKGEKPDMNKSFDIIKKAFKDGLISKEVLLKAAKNYLEKAVYADNVENRRLKRVGKEYGGSKKEEDSKEKPEKEEESEQPQNKEKIEQLENHAENTSTEVLERASKESDDEQVKEVAEKELEKRGEGENKEEKVAGYDVDYKEENGKFIINKIDGKEDYSIDEEDEVIKELSNKRDDSLNKNLMKHFFGSEIGDTKAGYSSAMKYKTLGKIELRIGNHSANAKRQEENSISIVTHEFDPTEGKFADANNINVSGESEEDAISTVKYSLKKELNKFAKDFEIEDKYSLQDFLETVEKTNDVIDLPQEQVDRIIEDKLKGLDINEDEQDIKDVLNYYSHLYSGNIEDIVEKSIQDDITIKNDYTRWL